MSDADLIQRLRARVENIYGGHGNIIESPDDDCIAAADAIERLTRERDEALRAIAWANDNVYGRAPAAEDALVYGTGTIRATDLGGEYVPPEQFHQEATLGDRKMTDEPISMDDCGDDARKWASAFRRTALRLGYSDMDEGWLIGWFANAIEQSHGLRIGRSKGS